MKLKLTILLLLCSIGVSAQGLTTVLLETGTTDFKNQSYAAMFGFTNFQDDSFHAGPLYKDYGSAYRAGIRVDINLNLNRALFVFIQGDIFANTGKQENSSFLENSVGLGGRIYKGLSLSLGYQMEVYNPVTKIRSEDQPLVKFGYKFRL